MKRLLASLVAVTFISGCEHAEPERVLEPLEPGSMMTEDDDLSGPLEPGSMMNEEGDLDDLPVFYAKVESGQHGGPMKRVRFGELPADVQASVRAFPAAEKNKSEWQRRVLALNRLGQPAVAFVAPGVIKPPTIALVIRDASAAIPRLVAIEQGATDDQLTMAYRAFAADEIAELADNPSAATLGTGRRVFAVLPDGQGVRLDGSYLLHIPPGPRSEAKMARKKVKHLFDIATNLDAVGIPGLGRVPVAR